MTYAGVNHTAPFTATSAVGYQTAIAAASQFAANGSTYVFRSWSDGGTRARNYTIPAANTTLTASYDVSSGVSTAPQGSWVGTHGSSGYALGQGAWASVPINVAAGGSATITVTLTDGLNPVLSGVFLN